MLLYYNFISKDFAKFIRFRPKLFKRFMNEWRASTKLRLNTKKLLIKF